MSTKISLWKVLFLIVLLAVCGTVGYMYFWPEKSLSPAEQTVSTFEGWRVGTLDLKANDAEKHWLGVQEYIGQDTNMAQLSDEQKRTVAFVLARKYVYENDMQSAFAHLVKLPPDESSLLWELPMFLYLAGEATAKEWLAQYRVETDRGNLALQDLSAQANMLWCDGRYEELLQITDPEQWEDWVEGTDPRRGWEQWLRLRRAKTLHALGHDDAAYAELNKSGASPDWLPVRQYPFLARYVIVEVAECALPVGKAAEFKDTLRRVRPEYDDVTRDVSGVEFQKRIDRILQAGGRVEKE